MGINAGINSLIGQASFAKKAVLRINSHFRLNFFPLVGKMRRKQTCCGKDAAQTDAILGDDAIF